MTTYYTDGSASPNPGPGGFAVIRDLQPWILGSEDGETTNIRMEGKALIAALKDADGAPCVIYSDSEFWINVVTKWAPGWEKRGWTKKGGDIKNLDIVRELYKLYSNSQADLRWVRGHEGNLFMAALEKMTGSFADAVELASEVLGVNGRVYPITLDDTTMSIKLKDGTVVDGQHAAESLKIPRGERPWLELKPPATINPRARQAILDADLVVIAPGLLYGSLAPALLVRGVTRALAETKAKKVYVCNLVTKPTQTDGFTVADFADEIERFSGVNMDYVLYNNHRPPEELIKKYAHDGEYLVEWDKELLKKKHYYASGKRLIADDVWVNTNSSSDPLAAQRSLIRHDADRVARELMRIYFA